MKVCIAGGGRVGRYLAQSLLTNHHSVVIIEPIEAQCRMLADSLDIPVICGDFERPNLIKLKSFFTALAVTSGCELCLIVGVSPEAQTYEMAMGGHEPVAEFTITNEILQSYWDEICCKVSGPPDYLQIGCPTVPPRSLSASGDT